MAGGPARKGFFNPKSRQPRSKIQKSRPTFRLPHSFISHFRIPTSHFQSPPFNFYLKPARPLLPAKVGGISHLIIEIVVFNKRSAPPHKGQRDFPSDFTK